MARPEDTGTTRLVDLLLVEVRGLRTDIQQVQSSVSGLEMKLTQRIGDVSGEWQLAMERHQNACPLRSDLQKLAEDTQETIEEQGKTLDWVRNAIEKGKHLTLTRAQTWAVILVAASGVGILSKDMVAGLLIKLIGGP